MKGNWQVLAGPFALWAFTRLSGSTPIRTDSCKGNSYHTLRNPMVYMTIAIWGIIAYLFFFEARDLYHFKQYTKNEITQAEQLIKNGRFAEAIVKLENITISAQNARLNAEKYHNLGVLYLNAGLIENAHDNLLITLKYNHSNPEACYLLACISFESKHYEESLIWLEDAKKLGCVKPKMYALEQQLLEILNKPR
ncbi:hypothetical protein J7M07_09460 [bacterium]|nr:hypothetical protein [bacterium]